VITDLWSREFPATVPLPKQIKLSLGGSRVKTRDVVIFTLLAEELEGSPVAEVPLETWDAAGRRVAL